MRDFFDASFAISLFIIVTIFAASTLSTRAATVEGSFETLPMQHANYSIAKEFVADTVNNPDNLTVFSNMNSARLASALNLPSTIRISLVFTTLLRIDVIENGLTVDVQLSGLTDLAGKVTFHYFDGSNGYVSSETKVTPVTGLVTFTNSTSHWIIFAKVGSASAIVNSPSFQVVSDVSSPTHMINRAGYLLISSLPSDISDKIKIGQTIYVEGQQVEYLIPTFAINPLGVGASTTSMVATYYQEPCLVRVDIL